MTIAIVPRGNVTLGTSTATQPTRDQGELRMGSGEDDCRIRFRRLGPYLIAVDNGQCGGHNATFSCAYRQTN